MSLPKTISETQKGLLEKKFSAVELVDQYLDRVKKFDKDLNSFITVTDKQARQQAKKTDKLISELGNQVLKQYPLTGVVVAHKDLFLTKAVRTTAASKVLEKYVPPYSATAVDRLEKAGCIMIGKTNCDAWAHGASGENSDFGVTKNPWNKAFVPGGSSSGSAAALSSNFCLIATGTDTGGSIRQPASFCNLVGLKPTYGAVSRYGVVAMASSLDSVGHMARAVEDVEKVFDVTKGEDGKDSTVKNLKFKIKNLKLKLGVPREYFEEGIDGEVREKVEEAIKVYRRQGIVVGEVSLPHTKYAISVYYIIMPAETSSNLARYDGIRYGDGRRSFGDEAKRRIMLGSYVLSAGYYDAYYLKAMKVRSVIINEYYAAFDKVDALIAPVSPTTPFKIGEKTTDPLKMYLSDILTVPANVAGIPALSVPCGFSKNGLPIGFQLMGPSFSENQLFELGKIYQSESPWHLKTPSL